MADPTPGPSELLERCALLRSFDRDSLLVITGCDTHEADALLGGPAVEPAAAGFRLRAEVAATALARLRAERPAAEAGLQQTAFAYYLARLQASVQSDRSPEDEDHCLHHLDALFLLLGAQMQWQKILDDTMAVRAALPRQPRHLQRLTLYEGYVYVRTQRYERADGLLTPLLEAGDLEPDVRSKALKALADAALFRSQHERALALYQQLYEAAGAAGDQVYQGLALLNMGMVFHELDRNDQALDHCERSLRLFRAQGDRVREAHACFHTALYSLYLGRWEAAERFRADAAQLFESLGLDGYLGFIYWMEGFLQHIFGDEAASEAAYLRARPLAESPEHGQPSLALDTWLFLGFLYQTQGRWATALDHYERAEALAIQLDRRQLVATIFFRRGQIYQREGRLDEALAAYRRAIEGVESLRVETESEDVKLGLLGTTQQIYEGMVLLCLARGDEAAAFHFVERARSRAFLDLLAQHSPALWGAVDQQVVSLAELQAQLPPGALLLEYFTVGVLPRGEHLINKIPAERAALREQLVFPPEVLLFAVDRGRFVARRLAVDPNRLRPEAGDRYPGRHMLYGRRPQYLYGQLVAPVADLLAGSDTLYIVPHGPLHYVPFGALGPAQGEYLLRADGPALAQAPSATILLRSCLSRPPAGGAGVLALGFNDAGSPQALRYAEAEARHIAGLFGGEAWSDGEPKSQRLFREGGRTRWLHIAGHARFEPGDPLGSALYLGRDDALTARAIIGRLELDAELVTLSSCTSGVSHVVPGDELLGLQRAFLYAGAPTVVCTRWEAHDLIALLVMDRFYSRLGQGVAPGIALRDAQVAVRELTEPELAALLERWEAEQSPLAAVLGEPAGAGQGVAELRSLVLREGAPSPEVSALRSAETLAGRPFADPLLWAPFMLIGRAG